MSGVAIPAPDIKEVAMDVTTAPMEGGAKTRRGRRAGRRTKTRRATPEDQEGGAYEMTVEKAQEGGAQQQAPTPVAAAITPAPLKSSAFVPATATAPTKAPILAALQSGGKTTVVIAPPKKKPAKVMFVPKEKRVAVVAGPNRVIPKKTFKAKRVRVVIDNTAKTQKQRTQTLGRIDAMTEDQLRGAAVSARLSRRETVAKVPVDLLRQMLKDYQSMRGNML